MLFKKYNNYTGLYLLSYYPPNCVLKSVNFKVVLVSILSDAYYDLISYLVNGGAAL